MYYTTKQDYLNDIFLLPLKVLEVKLSSDTTKHASLMQEILEIEETERVSSQQLLSAACGRHEWRRRDVM